MICKNCGGAFDDDLTKCPYCGSMNRKGAYKDFRKKIVDIIDKVFGLKEEMYSSLSSMLLKSVFRAIIMVVVCLAIAFVIVNFTYIGRYDYKKEDRQTYENIVWENDNIGKLNDAYERNDVETIRKLEAENYHVVRNWSHYASYYLTDKYVELQKYLSETEKLDDYRMSEFLYFLYYPSYYVYTLSMDETETEKYEDQCQTLKDAIAKFGYREDRLKKMYKDTSDGYGYIDYDKLKKMMEDANG